MSGCQKVKLQVEYAVVHFATVVVGCRENPFASNAQTVYVEGRGYERRCINGYQPVMGYDITYEYDGDDKLVFKQGEGKLIDCVLAK